MNYREAVIQVLKDEGRSLHYSEISNLAVERKYIIPKGKTPQYTINTEISRDIKKNGVDSIFIKYGNGVYGLREMETGNLSEKESAPEERHTERIL